MTDLPRLESRGAQHSRLIVDGAPFLAIGGELHNSSSSDPHYMRAVWDKVSASGCNTVIATVGWDQVEAVEGSFDFSVVDELLAGARSARVRLILIWFGAFKNAYSTYAPSWVRADTQRFPRAVLGEPALPSQFSYPGAMRRPVLSVFSDALLEADQAAYAAFVRYLAENDGEHTVIMIQVENEVGLLGSGRDRCALAREAWNAQVPEQLARALEDAPEIFHPITRQALLPATESGGSWADIFGDGNATADEAFMSWRFASYIETLAADGKRILPLPVFANAWLGPQAPGDGPGIYPSGGPTAGMLGVWRTAAPSLDLLAPDIYVPGSREVMEQYAVEGNPLFIPEARFRAGDAFLAVGRFRGIGYSVFGLEDGRTGSQFSHAARAILASTEDVVSAQETGDILGFALEPDQDLEQAEINGVTVTVRNGPKLMAAISLDVGVVLPSPPELPMETEGSGFTAAAADGRPFGLVAGLRDGSFLVVGQGALIDFSTDDAELEIDYVRELRLGDGGWVEGRIINGDERYSILPLDRIAAARIGLLRVPR